MLPPGPRVPAKFSGLISICVLGVTTRLDFVVFVVAFVAFLLSQAVAPPTRTSGLVAASTALAVLGQEVARRAYYGSWIPNTYRLKVQGFPLGTRLARGLTGVGWGTTAEWGAVVVFAIIALVPGRPTSRSDRARFLPLAAFLATATYSTWVGGDAWEWMRYPNRYLTPGVAILMCGAAAGIGRLTHDRTLDSDARSWTVAAAGLAILILIGAIQPFDTTRLQLLPTFGSGVAISGPVALGITLAIVVGTRLGRQHLASTTTAALLSAAVLASATLPGLARWTDTRGALVGDDAYHAQFGTMLDTITTSHALVAVVLAGAPIYFSHRTGDDMLGKSDTRIAALKPRAHFPFYPGHSKWDYRISIVSDRPDLVTDLWQPRRADVETILAAGYVAVTPTLAADPDYLFGVNRRTFPMFARADSRDIDWSALERVDPRRLLAQLR